jgi:branched-chain amino acid transport system substrate-binding protein
MQSSWIFTRRRLAGILSGLIGILPLSQPVQAETIRLGGLLSLSGNWSSLGKSSQVMMEFARDDLNDYLRQHGSSKRIQLIIKDTQLLPELAVKEYQQLVAQGAVSAIGPQSSAEVAALVDPVAKRKVPIISQGSTASSLSVAGDRIYRMVPNDTHEAEALRALLRLRNVKTLVPAWRDDAGNRGLHDSLQAQFTAEGGTMLPGVKYSTDDQQDFTPVVAEMNRQLGEALAAAGGDASKVGIYIAAFDEVARLMNAATQFPLLKSVKWYGSDGAAHSEILQNDAVAAQYAIDVGYPNPNLGPPSIAREKWQPLSDRYFAKTGERPDAYAFAAYDATVVAGLNASHNKSAPRVSRHEIFPETANINFGATGWTRLDEAGDRTDGDFEFWALRSGASGKPEWFVVCHYNSLADTIEEQSCAP